MVNQRIYVGQLTQRLDYSINSIAASVRLDHKNILKTTIRSLFPHWRTVQLFNWILNSIAAMLYNILYIFKQPLRNGMSLFATRYQSVANETSEQTNLVVRLQQMTWLIWVSAGWWVGLFGINIVKIDVVDDHRQCQYSRLRAFNNSHMMAPEKAN